MTTPHDLRSLTGSGRVPRPAFRWSTRVFLPLLILGGGAALLLYALRDTLMPGPEVAVEPVVSIATGRAPGASSQGPSIVAQAPGWIEPNPFAVSVPALTDGIIAEVLVLEGEHVEPGQVVARLIDADAKLAVSAAEAAVARERVEVERETAMAAAEAARTDEIRDQLQRKRPLVAAGAVTEGEVARLALSLSAQESVAKAAQAQARLAQARVTEAQVSLAQAQLTLQRTEVRAPSGGVVLSRLVEPGSRVMLAGKDPMDATVVRLYDPAKLQVRVDVPLADAAKVDLDQPAEVTTEALGTQTFKGTIIRRVLEANVQKNTVQYKVSIIDPSPQLKPEMLTRVRFLAAAAPTHEITASGTTGTVEHVPDDALTDRRGSAAVVWVVDPATSRVHRVEVAPGASSDGHTAVSGQVLTGQLVVRRPPPELREGAKVRITRTQVHQHPGSTP